MMDVEKSSRIESFLIISIIVLLTTWFVNVLFKPWFFLWRTDLKYDFGIPVLGSHWRDIFKIESWHETLKRIYYQFPSERFVILQGIGGSVEYLIRDPELVKQIAVRDFSSFVNRIGGVHQKTDPIIGHELTNLNTGDWKRVRNLLTPLLSGQKLKQIVIPSLDENKRDLVEFLENQMEQDHRKEIVVDMMDLSTRSAVDGFCKIAFGIKTDSLQSQGKEYGFFESSQSILKHFDSTSRATYWAMIFFPRLMKFMFGKTFIPKIDHEFFTKSCNDIADNRAINKISRPDYIQLLQYLRDNDSDDGNKLKNYNDAELISQCFEFYESVITENNLITTFLVRRLAEHTDIQQRLYNEIVDINRRIGDKPLSYDILNEMKFAEMIIYEGLRLCPIATELKRRATKPYVLESGNGLKVTVNPGDAVWLPAFILQNDPKYYENPSEFDPERFNEENRKTHVSGTYAPFGMGPRDCIGCQHPMAELKIIFYYLLLHFEFKVDNQSEPQKTSTIKLKMRLNN